MRKKLLGELGEEQAVRYLLAKNYRIIKQNFHCRFGEIDIIAFDPIGKLIFVEVKTRSSEQFGSASESLGKRKVSKLRKTAFIYLQENFPNCGWRIDLIAIQLDRRLKPDNLIHYKNILHG